MLQDQVSQKPAVSLEERIEYSNATQFRKLFLGIVDQLHANAYLRYIVTKHGEPRAVVMSFAAYNMMYRALQEVTKLQSEKSPSDAADIALKQLGADEAGSRLHCEEDVNSDQSASLIRRLNAVVEEVNDLRQLVSVVASGNASSSKALGRKPIRARETSLR